MAGLGMTLTSILQGCKSQALAHLTLLWCLALSPYEEPLGWNVTRFTLVSLQR